MKNKNKREALKVYEEAIIQACETRRQGLAKAQEDFLKAKAKAKKIYDSAAEAAGKE